jgi:putative heme iron utilization protein
MRANLAVCGGTRHNPIQSGSGAAFSRISGRKSQVKEVRRRRIVEQSQEPQPSGEFDSVAVARRLLHEARIATLATLLPGGAPYASLVLTATAPDASPVLLLSRLARHTQNVLADARVSLLISTQTGGDPLDAARLSIAGTIVQTDEINLRRRFLARHPAASGYADFKDFSFWRIEVKGAHLVAGFGRIADVAAADLILAVADAAPLLAAEEGALAHMNAEHADAVELYATKLLAAPLGGWRMIGVDPMGCDLAYGDTVRRLDFPQRIISSEALRRTLVDLARVAREQ